MPNPQHLTLYEVQGTYDDLVAFLKQKTRHHHLVVVCHNPSGTMKIVPAHIAWYLFQLVHAKLDHPKES